MQKKTLRKEFLSQRSKLSKEKQHIASDKIRQKILSLVSKYSPKCLLLFYAFNNEIDLLPLAQDLEGKVILGLPKVSGKNAMHFHIWIPSQDELSKNMMGIYEPQRNSPEVPFESVGLGSTWAIVPAIAIDRQGFRLGYGGGYYDAFFAKYPTIRKIGVVYHSFYVDHLPRESHDVAMDLIITEQGLMSS